MTSDTTWTLIGLGLCVLVLTLCGVAVLLDHWRIRREWEAQTAQALALVAEAQAATRGLHCITCGMDIIDLATHRRLYHQRRAPGIEDSW